MENTALEVLRLGFQMQPSDEAEVKVVELRPILCEALENVIAINATLKHLSFAVIRKTDKMSYAEVGLCKSIDSPITLLPIHILYYPFFSTVVLSKNWTLVAATFRNLLLELLLFRFLKTTSPSLISIFSFPLSWMII